MPGWQNPNCSPRNFPPPVPMETRNFLLPKVELCACALCPSRAPSPEPRGSMVWWELLVWLAPCLGRVCGARARLWSWGSTDALLGLFLCQTRLS